jgi:hypothetical protein
VFNSVLLRSGDGGDSWDVFYPAGQSENAVIDLLRDPDRPTRLWAAMNGLITRSDSSGAPPWTPDYPAIRDPQRFHALGVAGQGMYALSTIDDGPLSDGSAATRLGLHRRDRVSSGWVSAELPEGIEGGLSLAVGSDGELLIGTNGTGVWRLSHGNP